MARKRSPKPQRTYQGRLKDLPADVSTLLDDYADLHGRVERALFADMAKGVKPASIKSDYLHRFGISARQFNAVSSSVKGKIAAIKERRPGLIQEKKARIKKATKAIKSLERRLARAEDAAERHKLRSTIHQKRRRLQTLRDELAAMEADQRAGIVRLCFGSRKLFRAQFALEANGYASLDEWREHWRRARSSEFTVLGSKDETAGCQGCQVQHLGGNRFAFTLRLPDALTGPNAGGKHVRFEADLPHGAEHVKNALERGQAISYRFKRDAKSWRVFVTTAALPGRRSSDRRLGVIGMDINADHLAVTATDRHGNPVATRRISLVLSGCSTNQAAARIGEAVKEVMAFAIEQGKPLAVENLDFTSKKAQLEGRGVRYNRMLSSFAYERVLDTVQARALDAGIEVIKRNPAFTSIIGRYKFASRYGISDHQGAALAIARRAMNLSERPNRRDHNAPHLPVRNRCRHVWSFWRQVARREAALAAPGRSAPSRSRSSLAPGKTRTVTKPPGVGETPTRESLPEPFG